MNRSKTTYTQILLLLLGSIIVSLVIAELVVRDYKVGMKNMIRVKGGGLISHHFKGLYSYDKELGWIPSSNKRIKKWGGYVQTLDYGISSNGNNIKEEKELLVLAVGGSFVFGDEVEDNETWPAILESLIGHKVLNGGVSSYGLGQTVLRAEKLIDIYNPDVLIISFISDSINRLSLSVRHGVPKPYFLIENDKLVLKNTPVPFIKHRKLDLFRKMFGYSHLVHKLMSAYFPNYWWKGTMYEFRQIRNNKMEIAKKLFCRLAKYSGSKKRIIILVQSGSSPSKRELKILEPMLNDVLRNTKNVKVVNNLASLISLKENDHEELKSLFVQSYIHMSSKGNRFVAEQISKNMF